MKVLVTGATGFVGGEILKNLHRNGYDTFGTSKTGANENDPKIIKADITDFEDLQANVTEKFDAIIHSAGLAHQFGHIEKVLFEKVNVEGTKNISELAVRVKAKQFILISSTAVYGFHKDEIDESAECTPDTDYAESKLRGEIVCKEICEKNDIDLTIFRLTPVLGEKGIGNVPRLIKAIDKRRFLWVGDGRNKKSLIYVGDIADACRMILEKKKRGTEIFNLSAKPIDMRELVSIISVRLDKKVPEFSIPESIPRTFINLGEKLVGSRRIGKFSKIFDKWLSDNVYAAGKIKSEYGFEPKTSISEAVAKQCEWYSRQKKS